MVQGLLKWFSVTGGRQSSMDAGFSGLLPEVAYTVEPALAVTWTMIGSGGIYIYRVLAY